MHVILAGRLSSQLLGLVGVHALPACCRSRAVLCIHANTRKEAGGGPRGIKGELQPAPESHALFPSFSSASSGYDRLCSGTILLFAREESFSMFRAGENSELRKMLAYPPAARKLLPDCVA